jgi:hypothetical protein
MRLCAGFQRARKGRSGTLLKKTDKGAARAKATALAESDHLFLMETGLAKRKDRPLPSEWHRDAGKFPDLSNRGEMT